MSNVVSLRKYTKEQDIRHVMYDRQEFEQMYECEVCGPLKVIGGHVWHIEPIEDHHVK